MPQRPHTPEQFWAGVDNSGGPDACWPWRRSRFPKGYGKTQGSLIGREGAVSTHVVAFLLAGGVLLPGQLVRHSCDFRPCCNPRHLLAGTQLQNMADMMERGRGRGGRPPRLTWEQVVEIKKRLGRGDIQRVVAEEFGVSRILVNNIANDKVKMWRGA